MGDTSSWNPAINRSNAEYTGFIRAKGAAKTALRGKTYLKNAALLTVAGFALRALGMVFRVFVAARLGPEGMGLYQLILSVYMVFVSLASAGINVASTRLGAQCLTRGRGMAPTLRSLAATAAVLGTAAMLAQLTLADPLARFALHDSRAELGLCTLAPSLPFIAAAGALRGCFLARRRVEPNIIAQLVEQTVRMAVAALALVKLAHWGAAYACCAVLIGNTVSEAVSCGIMALFARQEPSFRPCADDPPRGYTSRELWEIVLPVTGSRLVASVLQAGESVLIPACLAAYLGTRAEAVAQYGSLKGMALPLIFFPFSVLAALSGLLMPEITRAHTARDTAALRRLVRLAMGAALVLFGKDAAILLYHDAQAGRYVQVLGFVAPFMYLESMVDAILKGMGEQLATFRYSVLDSILRIAGILWLMPQYGMPGFLAVMTASNLLTCGLNTGRMVRQLGERKSELRGKLGIRNEELEIGRRGDGKKINNNE